MSKYLHKEACRLCDGLSLSLVFSLGETPLANSFVKCKNIKLNQDLYPLNIFLCESCGHVQLLDVVSPKKLFDNYLYVSGTSPVFVEHFKTYAKQVVQRGKSLNADFIVDIGSNDGTLLKQFQNLNCRVLGVDPATNLVSKSNSIGIPTIQGFFTTAVAEEIYNTYGFATAITANNVFAHADNLNEIALGVKKLLSLDGIFIFEVSYLLDVINKLLFDTIYHEHLSYHSLTPLLHFFQKHDMNLFDVERVNTHGGSIRCYVQHLNGPHKISKSVNNIIQIERGANLFSKETFYLFEQNIKQLKSDLKNILFKLKKQGKKIVGFGAPAKATTLMHYFNIDGSIIDYIVDDSELKQHMYTPGYHIPIFETNKLYTDQPDYVLILAWNFSDSIIDKHHSFLKSGGHFITPLPIIKET